jgi:hypothetical protein
LAALRGSECRSRVPRRNGSLGCCGRLRWRWLRAGGGRGLPRARGVGRHVVSLAGGVWRPEGGRVRRMTEREREHARLKRAVADLTLDQQILKGAAEGKYQAPSAAGPVSALCKAGSASLSAGPAAPSVSRARRRAGRAACGVTQRRGPRRGSAWRPSRAATASGGSRRCRASGAGG